MATADLPAGAADLSEDTPVQPRRRPIRVRSWRRRAIPHRSAYLWQRIQRFIRADDVVVVENGTRAPPSAACACPAASRWSTNRSGSDRHTRLRLLGTLMAAPERRHPVVHR
ncbi:hypothetical protein J4732_15830 [Serratia marcescens]|uniref:Uncharacterized protein n=1 Tax=Serratia marcescens TaxID=615 RepID=A0A939SVE2_SERMA|nr:hypothetical protein [Serratia marcescens]